MSKKYYITQDDINNVQVPRSKYLDNNNESRLIKLYSQYVLTVSMFENNSDEVGLFVNIRNLENRYWFKGDENKIKVPLNYLRVLDNELRHSSILVHNYPHNVGFSNEDLVSFFSSNTLYILVAIQNNGSLHILKKFRYTNDKYADWYSEHFKTSYEYIKYLKNYDINDIQYIYRRFKI